MSNPTNHNNTSLRKPETIAKFNELEAAKKKAQINASHDRQLLVNNLAELRANGPSVILKNVVLPVVGVGAAVWGVGKLVGALTKPDTRTYYVEPQDEYGDGPIALTTRDKKGRKQAVRISERPANTMRRTPSAISYTKYIPVAVQLAKMGVSYLEKNGKPIPQFVHDLLSGPGVSPTQKVKPSAQ